MPMLSRIRKWLQENPNSVSSEEDEDDLRSTPTHFVRLTLVVDCSAQLLNVDHIPTPTDLLQGSYETAAKIYQASVLSWYRDYLSGVAGTSPFLNFGYGVIDASRIISLEALVVPMESK